MKKKRTFSRKLRLLIDVHTPEKTGDVCVTPSGSVVQPASVEEASGFLDIIIADGHIRRGGPIWNMRIIIIGDTCIAIPPHMVAETDI